MSSYWSRMLLCWLRQGLGDQRALFLGVRAVATLTTGTSAVPAPPARTTKRTLPECVASKRSFRTSAIRTSEADTAPSSPTPPSSSGKGKKGGLKPKKKKGKRPSSTAAYLQSRAEQLSRHEAAAKEANLPWRIVAASIVERHPIIMKEPEDWEAAYMEMQEEIAKHGKVFPPELNLMGQAAELDRSDDEVLPELPFKLAPRVTKADRLNDRTTLNRALAERLFLLIRGPMTRGRWDLPMAVLEGGGKGGDMKGLSMRKTHEATVRRFMGDKFEAYVPSNAPVGMHWRVPSEPSTGKTGGEQTYGDKVFFYRAQHLKGRGKVVGEGVEEFVWVTREEMGEYLPQASVEEKEYAELLTNIL